mgnify:FL=1
MSFIIDKPMCNTNQKLKYAARIGSTVELNCNVIANPTNVTFIWEKNEKPIEKASPKGKLYEEDSSVYSSLTVTPRYFNKLNYLYIYTHKYEDANVLCL